MFREYGYEVEVEEFISTSFWNLIYTKHNFLKKFFWTLYGYLNRILLLFRLREYDIVYIHLWVSPFGFPIFERLYRLFSKKIIYDIDDLIFQQKASENNSFVQKLKGHSKSLYLIKVADFVITTTPYLVDFCKKLNNNVVGIPPSLDTNKITPLVKQINKQIVIGWSGSVTTALYLKIVIGALEKLSLEYDFEFVVFGSSDLTSFSFPHRHITWHADIENEVLNSFDIALYPLENEVWSQGKYGGKLIQYLAAGLPILVSNANEIIPTVIRDLENGILVNNNNDDWFQKLKLLIEDRELRHRLSINARKTFINQFSLDANKNKYALVLEKI